MVARPGLGLGCRLRRLRDRRCAARAVGAASYLRRWLLRGNASCGLADLPGARVVARLDASPWCKSLVPHGGQSVDLRGLRSDSIVPPVARLGLERKGAPAGSGRPGAFAVGRLRRLGYGEDGVDPAVPFPFVVPA